MKKHNTMENFEFKDESYKIIGAAMEVHKVLGNGYLEAVYHEALCIEFDQRKMPYKHEEPLTINYKGFVLKKKYIPDFFCFNKIIVEVKASSGITSVDVSQAINYLKTTGCKLALLINFGLESLEYKRIVRSNSNNP